MRKSMKEQKKEKKYNKRILFFLLPTLRMYLLHKQSRWTHAGWQFANTFQAASHVFTRGRQAHIQMCENWGLYHKELDISNPQSVISLTDGKGGLMVSFLLCIPIYVQSCLHVPFSWQGFILPPCGHHTTLAYFS